MPKTLKLSWRESDNPDGDEVLDIWISEQSHFESELGDGGCRFVAANGIEFWSAKGNVVALECCGGNLSEDAHVRGSETRYPEGTSLVSHARKDAFLAAAADYNRFFSVDR